MNLVRTARTTILLGAVLLAGIGQAGDSGIVSADAGAASLTHTDLRVPSPEQILRAAAKFGISCGATSKKLLGEVISVAVASVANAGTLGTVLAHQLACALDATPGTSCDRIKECEAGPLANLTRPTCVGSVAITMAPRSREPRAVNCAAYGADCYETELEAVCGLGPCKPGETYSCDGTSMVSCVHGVRAKTQCPGGDTCVTDLTRGLIECRGAGYDCSGDDRCDGHTVVGCRKDALGHGHEARLFCGIWGLTCRVTQVPYHPTEAACVPRSQASCDPSTYHATCSGTSTLRTCVVGNVTDIKCSDLGYTGGCASSGGALGEATCRASP